MTAPLLTAEATVQTPNASKILKWLCGHFKIKVPAEYDAQKGHVDFPFGVCEMTASDAVLYIHVAAPNAEAFALIKEVVGEHLEKFGNKESLRADWEDKTVTAGGM
ncbi:MAG: DUF2218 domain-containing protein [Anaerolineae bacterium]|nr:DUF2218 domain-containing protein [Anaerolineae bacterium]